jgi:hypothetical protein
MPEEARPYWFYKHSARRFSARATVQPDINKGKTTADSESHYAVQFDHGSKRSAQDLLHPSTRPTVLDS